MILSWSYNTRPNENLLLQTAASLCNPLKSAVVFAVQQIEDTCQECSVSFFYRLKDDYRLIENLKTTNWKSNTDELKAVSEQIRKNKKLKSWVTVQLSINTILRIWQNMIKIPGRSLENYGNGTSAGVLAGNHTCDPCRKRNGKKHWSNIDRRLLDY